MISTQPGSTPLSSFKIVSLEEDLPISTAAAGNGIGPYGEQDDEKVFLQKLVPETDLLTVRLASARRTSGLPHCCKRTSHNCHNCDCAKSCICDDFVQSSTICWGLSDWPVPFSCMICQVERAGYEAVCKAAALLENLSLKCEQGSLHYLALATQVRCGVTCAAVCTLARAGGQRGPTGGE